MSNFNQLIFYIRDNEKVMSNEVRHLLPAVIPNEVRNLLSLIERGKSFPFELTPFNGGDPHYVRGDRGGRAPNIFFVILANGLSFLCHRI